MFISYDSTAEPDPKVFKQGILNSFFDPEARVNFLNKFYQCLMAGKMPRKVLKLVSHGPKDSGKTSGINVLLGIIPMTDVASITQERWFAAAMIEEHTQLVVLDEWSEYTLQSDMAKSVLQGRFMVKSVKHKTAKCIRNKALFTSLQINCQTLVPRISMCKDALIASRHLHFKIHAQMLTNG